MSFHNKDANIGDLKKINKIINKTKEGETLVRYSRIGDFRNLKILAISDASYLKFEDKKSVSGYFIFLSEEDEERVAP